MTTTSNTKRIKIPAELARRVEFASDRTCCVCQDRNKRYQIAHINDNPADNSFDNLAVLCLACHDEAHIRGGLARTLTPEMVKLYNSTWRDKVRGRLIPNEDVRLLREYQHEVMLEIGLACEAWSNKFLLHVHDLKSGLLPAEEKTFGYLSEHSKFTYSQDTWIWLKPLAEVEVKKFIKCIEKIQMLHAPAIPVALKTTILRSLRQLKGFSFHYGMHPMVAAFNKGFLDLSPDEEYRSHEIDFGFVFETLLKLSEEATQVRKSTEVYNDNG